MPKNSILLIEYEASLRDILSDCLSELGSWRVTPSSSIQAGLNWCTRNRPDVILIDASSPENDVLLFVEQLKKYSIEQAVPILLISARANWFTLRELKQMGFAGAISKPFNPSTLSAQVFRLMSLSQAKA